MELFFVQEFFVDGRAVGGAHASRGEARGAAESIPRVAQAKAEANKILTESLTPPLLEYEALQRWDGILPKVTGGTVPFINLDNIEKGK